MNDALYRACEVATAVPMDDNGASFDILEAFLKINDHTGMRILLTAFSRARGPDAVVDMFGSTWSRIKNMSLDTYTAAGIENLVEVCCEVLRWQRYNGTDAWRSIDLSETPPDFGSLWSSCHTPQFTLFIERCRRHIIAVKDTRASCVFIKE